MNGLLEGYVCCHCQCTLGEDNWYPSSQRNGARICKACVNKSLKEWRRAHRERINAQNREWRVANKSKVRALQQIGDVVRRRRMKAVVSEPIDPMVIFQRDKWRCKMCGRKTPRSLMGTNNPSAPSIDHIIPLSLGGPHTKRNLRCLCRRCNGTKAAKYEGQLAFV